MIASLPRLLLLIVALSGFAVVVDAVTVLPGGVPRPYAGTPGVATPYDFFTQSAPNAFDEFGSTPVDFFMSDRDNIDYYVQDDYRVLPSADSFVRGALQAWGEHLHLVLQPDEMWLTVLAQVNFYLNAQQATPGAASPAVFDLRANDTTVLTAYPDWYTFIAALYGAVTQRVVQPAWLQHQWISPNFTTSTDEHVMAAHILMLAQTRAYLRPPLPRDGQALLCGLPSVTLLGTRQDWQVLQWRVEQLPLFGTEAAAYGARLLPVVRRFVQTFDRPDDAAIRAFWNAIVVATPSASLQGQGAAGATTCSAQGQAGNGPTFNITGWITAFYYWDVDGQPYGRNLEPAAATTTLDNVTYPSVDLRTLPVSYGRTSIVLPRWNETDNFAIRVLGGALGKRIDTGAPPGYFEALNRTRHMAVAPWEALASNGSDISTTTDGRGHDIDRHNQTWVQWAHASFGYDPRRHATLTPLTSWLMYGPPGGQWGNGTHSGSGSSNSGNNAGESSTWQAEMELGTVATALLSSYNTTQCGAGVPRSLPRRRWTEEHGP